MAGANAAMAPAVPEQAEAPRQPASALTKRIASAAVMLPLALAAWWMGGAVFAMLAAFAAYFMLREWLRFPGEGPKSLHLTYFWMPLLLALGSMADGRADWALGLLAVFIVLLPVLQRQRPLWALAGAVYIGLPCLCLVWLRGHPGDGRLIVLWLLAVVWATDTGAYIFGRVIGGPKLIPVLSPNKTWAGLGGGMLCAAVTGGAIALLGSAPGHELPWLLLALFSALVAVVSLAGDFFESGVKRHFGVKDSGALIPGHGGALDRLDGLLFAAPFAALGMLLWGDKLWP